MKQYTEDSTRINTFLSKITRSQKWWQLDQGLLSMNEAENYFINEYPEEMDLLVPFLSNWMDILTPIDKNVQLLKTLINNDYNLYILSNFIKEAFDHVKKLYNFFDLFDGIILSYEVKAIKPDIKIYDKLIKHFKLDSNESVFLDDIRGFLKPAEYLGMKTILVTPDMDIRQKLKELDVKI